MKIIIAIAEDYQSPRGATPETPGRGENRTAHADAPATPTPISTEARGCDGGHATPRAPQTGGPPLMIVALDDAAQDCTGYYLAKPIGRSELLRMLAQSEVMHPPARPQLGRWTLSRSRCELSPPRGEPIPITPSEAALLEPLMRTAGHSVSRKDLAAALGENYLLYDDRRIQVRLSRLRAKLRPACGPSSPLRADRGRGYAFVEPCGVED